jgi:hypothetical protein
VLGDLALLVHPDDVDGLHLVVARVPQLIRVPGYDWRWWLYCSIARRYR